MACTTCSIPVIGKPAAVFWGFWPSIGTCIFPSHSTYNRDDSYNSVLMGHNRSNNDGHTNYDIDSHRNNEDNMPTMTTTTTTVRTMQPQQQ
jgi:hypothetical protein